QAVVRGRQKGDVYAERAREAPGDGRERLAGSQRLRPHQMKAEVEIAEAKPRLAAEARDRSERVPRLAGATPAALLVAEIGQRVEDAVEVGRHVQTEHIQVVADVADDRDVLGWARL